jgi:hypothetical protein
MFAYAGNLVSGVTNRVYSTIFGDEPETIVVVVEEPDLKPELEEPKVEQTIPPIENLQINSSPLESYTPTIHPSPRATPTIQNSPRASKIETTKNFDARTKNLHAALTSPSTGTITSASFGSPQKSAFKKTDSPSRGGQVPVHLVYGSPISRPQSTYPYDSPKKRMHDQIPQKYEDSYKKTKFGNSPQPGSSRSASYNNSYNTSLNGQNDSSTIDSPRAAKKQTREEHSKNFDLRSSAHKTENKKMKHEPERETNQVPLNKRADSLYSLKQVLSSERKVETSYYSDDDDDIRKDSARFSLKPSTQMASPVLSVSKKPTKLNSTPLVAPSSSSTHQDTSSSPLVASLSSSKKKPFSTLPPVLPKPPTSYASPYKTIESKPEPNSLFGSLSSEVESISSASSERDTRSMSLDPTPSTKKTPESTLASSIGLDQSTEPIVSPAKLNSSEAQLLVSGAPSTAFSAPPTELGTPNSASSGVSFGTPTTNKPQATFGTQVPTATLNPSSPEVHIAQVISSNEEEICKINVKYREKQSTGFVAKGDISEARLLKNLEGKSRLVIKAKDKEEVYSSIPITATLLVKKEGAKNLQSNDFELVCGSAAGCEELLKALNDSIKKETSSNTTFEPKPQPATIPSGVEPSNAVPSFGSQTNPTTQKQPHFGAFVKPVDSPTSMFAMPSTPVASEAQPQSDVASLFNSNSTPLFGSSTSSSPFGAVTNSATTTDTMSFGVQPKSTNSLFGTQTDSATQQPLQAPFGSNTFAASVDTQPSSFGISPQTETSSSFAFGTPTNPTSTTTTQPPIFGTPSTTTKNDGASLFGTPSSTPQSAMFGTQSTTGSSSSTASPWGASQASSDSSSLFGKPNTLSNSFNMESSSQSTTNGQFGTLASPSPSTGDGVFSFGSSSSQTKPTTTNNNNNNAPNFFSSAPNSFLGNSSPSNLFGNSTPTASTFGPPNSNLSSPFASSLNTSPPKQNSAFAFGAPSNANNNNNSDNNFSFGGQSKSSISSTKGKSSSKPSTPTQTPSSSFSSMGSTNDLPFGSKASTNDSPFGSKGSTNDSPFGSKASTNDSPFGSKSSINESPSGSKGSTNESSFGSKGSTNDSPFGSMGANFGNNNNNNNNNSFSFGNNSNNSDNSNNSFSFGAQPKSNTSSTKGKSSSKPSTPTQTPSLPFTSSPFGSMGSTDDLPFGSTGMNFGNNNNNNNFGFNSSNNTSSASDNADMDMGDNNCSNGFLGGATNSDSSSDIFSVTSGSKSQPKPAASTGTGPGGRRIVVTKSRTAKK